MGDEPRLDLPSRKLERTKHQGIYRRGGRYVVRFRDSGGVQRQRAARTLAEARRVQAELKADVQRGEYRPETKERFAAYADRFREVYSGRTNRGVRAKTIEEYERDLARAKAYFGGRHLAEVTPQDVKAFITTLRDEGLAPATVRRIVAPLKLLFATAYEDGLIRSNPAAGIRIAAPAAQAQDHDDDEDARALTAEQLAALVDNVPEGWERLLVMLLAESGLRIGEGLALTWAAIDTENRRIQVRQRIRGTDLDRPKSRRGRRDVPISAALVRDLREHRLRSPHSGDEDYVFTTRNGKPQHARNAYRWLKPAARAAGADWAGFHALRHTAASRWLHGGVSIAQVSRLLGHADASFTLRVYISVLPDDLPDGNELAAAVGLR